MSTRTLGHFARVAIVKDSSLPDDLGDINNYGDPSARRGINLESVGKIEKMLAEAIRLSLDTDFDLYLDSVRRRKRKQTITVLIKPNLTQVAEPVRVTTTDPRVVQALCCYLASVVPPGTRIRLADNTSYGPRGSARRAFETSGIKTAALAAGVAEEDIVPLDEDEEVPFYFDQIKDGLGPPLTLTKTAVFKTVLEADFIINLAKLKTQLDEQVSLGLKNWQGIMPYDIVNQLGEQHTMGRQGEMAQQGYHRADLSQKIVDLHRIVPPQLTIIDGLWGMEGQGPWEGTPVKMDLIIAGVDTVAVDATASRCMGIDPFNEVVAIRTAHAYGLGTADEQEIEIVGRKIEEVKQHFRRSNWNPVGLVRGVHVHVGGTCIGCMATIRAFLDTLKNRDSDQFHPFEFEKLFSRVGEVHVFSGLDVAVPSAELNGLIVVVGDCCYLKTDAIPHFRKSTIERIRERDPKEIFTLKEYKGCNPATAMSELVTFIEDIALEGESLP